MPLLQKGQRLSVQTVSKEAYEAVVELGEKGGFEALLESKAKKAPSRKRKVKDEIQDGVEPPESKRKEAPKRTRKAKMEADADAEEEEQPIKEESEQAEVESIGTRRGSRRKT